MQVTWSRPLEAVTWIEFLGGVTQRESPVVGLLEGVPWMCPVEGVIRRGPLDGVYSRLYLVGGPLEGVPSRRAPGGVPRCVRTRGHLEGVPRLGSCGAVH
jgi:hypothetical protein